ncbi:hypothetical protein FACS1894137_05470 [Spirochaetia bacterium]|nr:hypothetical protein FACS1894137_05470 [Spirochaetia bacterium]
MRRRGHFFINVLGFLAVFSLSAQTHVSVPVDDSIYYVLEQAELRGLCKPLPKIKPYSQALILSAIREILASEDKSSRRRFNNTLNEMERRILEDAKQRFAGAETGLSWERGAYRFETAAKEGTRFSGELGIGMDMIFSGGLNNGDVDFGTNTWGKLYMNGDMGEHFSYGINILGGLMRAPRSVMGTYHTYYEGYDFYDYNTEKEYPAPPSYVDQEISSISQPVSFFPYSFQKNWVVLFGGGGFSAGGITKWPQSFGIGANIISEMSGSALKDNLTWRFGRLRREWGGMSNGSSLIFNAGAQPFVALEATFAPVYWFNFSALTGVLEYNNVDGIKASAQTNQNAFSIEQLEFNYKNYFHFDIGSSAVWPKRFELGYIFPIKNNFIYQYNIGDFDNMGIFVNGRLQYPGIGGLWLSVFLDEVEVSSVQKLFVLDRQMFALQGGLKAVIPWLSFTSVSVSYTKIEPYTYTHTRNYVPWYGNNAMEVAYTNNGVGLGYYLPPNSDELKFRLETIAFRTTAHIQYQMIRHGADFGSKAVDGSSYLSELDPDGRSEKAVLRKYFLKDGAYQWQHIIKIGGEHTYTLGKIPIQVFGEGGVVFSYFTDINGEANSGRSSAYSAIDTDEYPKSTSIIGTLGIRLFL